MTPHASITHDRWLASLPPEWHINWSALRALSDPVRCARCKSVFPDRQQFEAHLGECQMVVQREEA